MGLARGNLPGISTPAAQHQEHAPWGWEGVFWAHPRCDLLGLPLSEGQGVSHPSWGWSSAPHTPEALEPRARAVLAHRADPADFARSRLAFCLLFILRRCFSCFMVSSVQSLSRVRLCDPVDCSTPGFPVHHQLPELAQTPANRVGDAIQPSHFLLIPSPPAFNPSQHQGLFQ